MKRDPVHPSSAEERAAPSPLGVFDCCPRCDGPMRAEHAHYRCGVCGWRDSCCD